MFMGKIIDNPSSNKVILVITYCVITSETDFQAGIVHVLIMIGYE